MEKTEKKDNKRIPYQKPEAQRLSSIKAHADCLPGSGDENCMPGATPSFMCMTGAAAT
jgi:hypothetical protein